jgi:hypothetical protein
VNVRRTRTVFSLLMGPPFERLICLLLGVHFPGQGQTGLAPRR